MCSLGQQWPRTERGMLYFLTRDFGVSSSHYSHSMQDIMTSWASDFTCCKCLQTDHWVGQFGEFRTRQSQSWLNPLHLFRQVTILNWFLMDLFLTWATLLLVRGVRCGLGVWELPYWSTTFKFETEVCEAHFDYGFSTPSAGQLK